MRIQTLTGLFLAIFVQVSAVATELNADNQQSPLSLKTIPVCYNFGCEVHQSVSLTESEWLGASGWFTPVSSAAEERQQIRQAIGWMEVLIGRYTPTNRDIGMNLAREGETPWPGQLDCIDESTNTTTYLKLFEQRGLLKWHRVVERVVRRSIWDQHWTAQVEELKTGARYAIDSWFQDNGTLPYVQKIEDWLKMSSAATSLINTAPESLNR